MAHRRLQTNLNFAQRVAPVGFASVGRLSKPSGRLPFHRGLHFVGSVGALWAVAAGVPLDNPSVISMTCAAILLFGLPHGTFDLALIGRAHASSRIIGVLALYLGCAAAMYGLWQYAPTIALIVFFALSIVHFAEDWTDYLPSFFARGTSLALLVAPVFLHQRTLEALFAMLVGEQSATIFIAIAVMVAPLSMAIASVAVVALWHDAHRDQAVATGLALAAMVFAPPIIGFALFFCLMHSPAQFVSAQRLLTQNRSAQWLRIVIPLTCAALGIAALILSTLTLVSISNALIVTAFVTLSILTLPHMIVPTIVAGCNRYGQRSV